MTISIYRPGTPVTLQATVEIDEKTVYQKKLMEQHKISSEFISSSVLSIQIGDYITYNEENYYINRLPEYEKISNSAHRYKVEFESVLYDLGKKLLISSDGLADFPLNGMASDFLALIVTNLNDTSSGWSSGPVTTTDYRELRFANESCRSALTRIAEEFKLEFSITGKAISLIDSVGSIKNYTFQYGKGLGLYNLRRQQVSNQNIITKCYGFGGTKNIPSGYRGRAKRLVFESSGNRYLTKNAEVYGVIEGQFTDDNIYPKRTGTVSSANIVWDTDHNFDNINSYVEDSGLDFDINDYLIEGMTATIVFKSGDLGGIECEIWKYDHATKRIYFNPFSDTDGYTLPYYNAGSPIEPKTGDTYTLINISLPQSYIDAAEAELMAATQKYIDENSIPQVVYSIEIDPHHARINSISFDAGDRVTIKDTDLGINNLIRTAGIEYPLVDPFQIKALIADFVPYTTQERIYQRTINTRKEVVFVDRRNAELYRRNAVRQNQLKGMLYDTDGYFSPEGVSPLWIETLNLSVGAKSSDFRLNGVTISPNHEGNKAVFVAGGGSLIHFQISVDGNYIWNIGAVLTVSNLVDANSYYLYAKCSKTAMTGEWELTTEKKGFDGVGYYYFFVGILYSVYDGYRDFDFGYGMTYINGRIITTGRIRSLDGLNYFDLDSNQFRIGGADSGIDWNVSEPDTLTVDNVVIKNSLLSDVIVANMIMSEYAEVDNLGVKYFNGVPVPAGDLSGTVVNVQPNIALSAPWQSDFLYQTGDKCSNDGTNYIASGPNTGEEPPSGNWNLDPDQPQKRIDKVTLTGTSGTASVVCDSLTKLAIWNDNGLAATASDFVALYSAAYLAGGVVVTSDGADIVFTAQTAGIDFSGTTSITNTPDENRGSVKITGNSIFNSTENSDFGTIRLNMKGYNGGLTKYRRLLIGDGRGGILADFRGNIWGGLIALKASKFLFTDIPTSSAGLDSGQVWNNNGTLNIIP